MDGFARAQEWRQLVLRMGVRRIIEPADRCPTDFFDRLSDGRETRGEVFPGGNSIESNQADILARNKIQFLERLQRAESSRIGNGEYGGKIMRALQAVQQRPASEECAWVFGLHMAINQFRM